VYVAMVSLGGGVGSIMPENLSEYFVFFLLLLFGSVLWAMVIGTICGFTMTGDPHEIRFRQSMDALNYFLDDMQISNHLRLQAREYMRNTKELMKHKAYNVDVIDRLSIELRGHIVTEMSSMTLERIWFLRDLEAGCRLDLAVKLQRAGYNARERMPADRISIVTRGVAAKAGFILTFGNVWGEDSIVRATSLRDSRMVSALT